MMKNILLLLVSIFVTYNSYSKVWINEVVSSNQNTISDEDGNYSDWIELYNDSNMEVDLTGYYLSDDDKKLNKWKFSYSVIPAKGYLLVWASSKDKIEEDGTPHTNFNISADGEPIILTDADGEIVDSVNIPALERDKSYTRIPDGSSNWLISSNTTPRGSNVFIESITPPVFSENGGFFTQNFTLTLSNQNPNAIILYTIDGSDPIIENLGGKTYQYKNKYKEFPIFGDGRLVDDEIKTYEYTVPIEIKDRTLEPLNTSKIPTTNNFDISYIPTNTRDVFKGTVVKARTYLDGFGYSPVVGHTYFVHEQGRERYQLPVISLSTSKEDLFEYNKGIYVAGVDFDEWRKDNPLVVANPDVDANYHRRGDLYEYPLLMEYFDAGKKSAAINQTVGYRIHGGWSRADGQKGLRIYARNDYGNNKIKHKIFKDSEENEFKRLIIKNTSNIRVADATCQKIFKHLRFDTQSSQFAYVFVNGEFWGLQEVKERFDKNYLENKYGIDPDNIDYLSNNMEVGEGDSESYKKMIDYVNANDLSISENYKIVANQIDLDNYIDYQAAEIYANNKDWPHNNIDYWRVRTDEILENVPYGHDGKWRWLAYDLDMTLNNVASDDSSAFNTLDFVTRTHNSTVLFRNLIKSNEFVNQFVSRFADLLNTSFLPERLAPMIEEDKEAYLKHLPEHITRWKYISGGMSRAEGLMNRIISFAKHRPGFMRNHIQEKFNLTNQITLTLDLNEKEANNYIKINTIDINEKTVGVSPNPYPWSGVYFDGIPVTLTAIPDDGYIFSHWEGLPEGTPQTYTGIFSQNTQITAHFQKLETFDLIYTSSEGGFLIGDTIQNVVINQNGTKVEAVAQNGYTFLGWSDGINTTDRIDTAVQNNIQVQALFELVTSLDEKSIFKTLVYPNPSKEVVFIEKNTPLALQYQLLDLNGRVVGQGKINHPIHTINILHLPMSMYILKLIEPSGEEASFKILKH